MMKSFTNYQNRSVSRISRTLLTAAALVAGLLAGSAPQVEAQIVYNEPFTVGGAYPQLILPRGWTQGKINGTSSWNEFTVVDGVNATNPNPAPFPTGPNVLRFGSFLATAGDASFIASKRFDMRNHPGAGVTFNFKMYRDNGYVGYADRIQVFLNDSASGNASLASMTLLAENGTAATTINRQIALAPVVGANGWYTYTYTIPPAWNTANTYVVIIATSEFGNNIYIDDFQLTSYPAEQVVVTDSLMVVQQNINTTAPSATNQQIIGVRVLTDGYGNGMGGINGAVLTNMIFNTNGSTNPVTDINNAKIYTTGGTPFFSMANAQLLATHTSPHFTNYGFFIPNVATYYPAPEPTFHSTLEHGENYLWITYDIKPGATPGNFVDAEWVDISVSHLTNLYTPTPYGAQINPVTLPGNRLIDVVYCQPNYTVGTSWNNYMLNDYINGVELDGDVVPGIQNGLPGTGAVNPRNRIVQPCGIRCPTASITVPALCAYQHHTPDYEVFPETGYNITNHGVTVTQTSATFTAFSSRVSSPTNPAGYTIPGYGASVSYLGQPLGDFKLQVGDYGSANAIAAWIDYNGDGTFNNYFDNLRKVASGTSGTNTLTLSAPVAYTSSFTRYYGLDVGMKVYGPGVPVGTYITAINQTTHVVTLSANLISSPVSEIFEFVNDGTNGSPGNRGEKIAQSGPLGGWAPFIPQFKVPDYAASFSGKRRLRVREVWINYNITPCNTNTYGETEDYTVTIRPECPVYSGPDAPYKTWMGLTSDWSDPANWCPEGAPIQGNTPASLRFPGGPTGAVYPYTKAMIAGGQLARAIRFRIETGDTVFIDAPQGSDLLVTDTLKIWTPTSALILNTARGDTAQMYNGVLQHDFVTDPELIHMVPMRVGKKVRSMWIYRPAEFAAQGMKYTQTVGEVADVIDTIRIHMQRNSDGNVYKNFKIKYYYTNNIDNFNNYDLPPINAAAPYPAAPITVFSGDLNVTSIPAGGWGTIAIPLTGGGIPYYFKPATSVTGRLIIDISYDQSGFPLTGTSPALDNEDIRFTQTQSDRFYMTWSSNSNGVAAAAENMVPTLHGVFPGSQIYAGDGMASWVAADALAGATTIEVTDVTGFVVGMTVPWDGMLVEPALIGLTIAAINPAALPNPTITFTTGLPYGIVALNGCAYGSHYQVRRESLLRPNLTFSWKRIYIKYPIEVKGAAWENNGNFIPATSRVTFSGSNTDIEGTATTTFFDLDVNNSVAVRQDGADIMVQDTLRLLAGRLKLNNRQATLLKPEKSALLWTAGRLQMDNDVIGNNVAPFSRLKWNMATATDMRVIPTVGANGTYLPMTYKPATGTHNVTFTTYRTNPDNTNIPSPTVTNIFGWTGSTWGSTGDQLADRFYRVENLDAAASVDYINFSYQGSASPVGERSANNSTGLLTTMKAQRWLNDTTKWEQFPSFHPTQNYYVGTVDSVRVNTFTFGAPYGYWWVITGISTPLPVELLDFTAIPYQDRVKLQWSTAAEINSSHFVVERTVDNHDFSFIGQVQANGTTSVQSDYSLWDLKPVEGIQYYYLRQYDRDGQMKSYGPVSAKFTKEAFEIVTATISSSENGLQVVFSYDSEEPVNYRIVDMTGRVVASKDRNPATPGLNVIDIDVTLAKGAYQIILMNRDKQVTRKFFY